MEKIVLIIFGFAAVIGLWALACLTVAMAKSGRPVQFVRTWLKAVTGR